MRPQKEHVFLLKGETVVGSKLSIRTVNFVNTVIQFESVEVNI
jgi:hypothetical protein